MKLYANLLKIRLFAVAMGLLISASLTQAALIDNGTFTTDNATGLDWLDMSYTDGNSYNQTLAAISAGGSLVGWRFATSAEFDGLINAAVGSSYTQGGAWQSSILGAMTTLEGYLGSTYTDGGSWALVIGHVDSGSDPRMIDTIARSFAWSYIYHQEYMIQSNITFKQFKGWVRPENDPFPIGKTKDYTSSKIGSFLVRATAVPDSGSTAALLSLGVVALAFARRRLG